MMFFFNPWFVVSWILASWLIGMIGRLKRFGFFGNFLISFLFSPLVGVIVILASDDRRPRRGLRDVSRG